MIVNDYLFLVNDLNAFRSAMIAQATEPASKCVEAVSKIRAAGLPEVTATDLSNQVLAIYNARVFRKPMPGPIF